MEPLIPSNKKRESASLVFYKKNEGEYTFYLQQRDKNAERAPGMIGIWGGGREGEETPEENLKREMQEELEYVPTRHQHFSHYESNYGLFDIFIEEVGDDFEAKTVIHEGEYGLWMKSEEVLVSAKTTPLTKLIISQVAEYLAK